MPTYMALMNWTDQGIRSVKETTQRSEHAEGLAQKRGPPSSRSIGPSVSTSWSLYSKARQRGRHHDDTRTRLEDLSPLCSSNAAEGVFWELCPGLALRSRLGPSPVPGVEGRDSNPRRRDNRRDGS